MGDYQSIGMPPIEWLDEIERRRAAERQEEIRILSAAAWTPEPVGPRRGVWSRLLAWIGRRA